MVKRILKWIGIVLGVAIVVLAGFVGFEVMSFNSSLAKVYEIPPPNLARSTDVAVIARGKHLTESIGNCSTRLCHGSDLSGGGVIDIGPVGQLSAPNLTPAGLGGVYSDGELARLLIHGIKRDGRSLRFMPVPEINWLPDDDLVAIISYVRTVPPVTKPDRGSQVGVLGKVLDRLGKFDMDVARRIDHEHRATAPIPAPNLAYGAFVGRLCTGCHGEHLSGGAIPGAPPSIPIPKNITPHESGIKLYTFDDFNKLLDAGVKRDGSKLDPFMPVEALSKMDAVERQALWAFLRSVEPRPFGQR